MLKVSSLVRTFQRLMDFLDIYEKYESRAGRGHLAFVLMDFL
jgi:hypothetical protein